MEQGKLGRTVLGVIVVLAGAGYVKRDWLMARVRRSFDRAPPSTARPEAPDDKPAGKPEAKREKPLVAERRQLKSSIEGERDDTPAPEPPAGVLEKVTYDAPLGKNVAYVTPVKPGARGPAMVWIHGGMAFDIGELAWTDSPRENDQSGAAFRKAGIVEMFPAPRGANGNPGHNECFFGEVDDIIAAAELLARRPDVDPQRIYLGGHSTGATMVLLAAASSDRFRGVFAFGPVADVRQYGPDGCLPQGISESEWRPRAPIEHLFEITTPTFVIEGAKQGNAAVFPYMQKRIGKAPITFLVVPGATHFDVLAPGTEVVARAILADTGPAPGIRLTVDDLVAAR